MNKLAVYVMPVRESFPPREICLRRFARHTVLSGSLLAVTLWLGLPPRVPCAQELTDPPKILSVEQLLDERQDDQVEAMTLYTHGQLLLRRGDVANALRRFQRAWRFDPQLVSLMDEFPEDIGVLNDLGYLWVDQGKHLQRSLRMVRKAVEAEPDNIAYRDSLGWAYYRLEQYDAAVRELRKAAAAEPPDGVILDHLGDALLAARQSREAIKVWRQAVAAFQQADQLQQVDATQAKMEEQISQTTTP